MVSDDSSIRRANKTGERCLYSAPANQRLRGRRHRAGAECRRPAVASFPGFTALMNRSTIGPSPGRTSPSRSVFRWLRNGLRSAGARQIFYYQRVEYLPDAVLGFSEFEGTFMSLRYKIMAINAGSHR